MSEAFTVRLRTTGGRVAFWLAPAGGMGLSFPCCVDGHDSDSAALVHGTHVLAERLRAVTEPDWTAFAWEYYQLMTKPLAS